MRNTESMEVKVKPTFKCHRTGETFGSMIDIYEHRMKNWPTEYVYGVPFEFLEVVLTEKEMHSLPDDWDDATEAQASDSVEEEIDLLMSKMQMQETCEHPRAMIAPYNDGAFCRLCYLEVEL